MKYNKAIKTILGKNYLALINLTRCRLGGHVVKEQLQLLFFLTSAFSVASCCALRSIRTPGFVYFRMEPSPYTWVSTALDKRKQQTTYHLYALPLSR